MTQPRYPCSYDHWLFLGNWNGYDFYLAQMVMRYTKEMTITRVFGPNPDWAQMPLSRWHEIKPCIFLDDDIKAGYFAAIAEASQRGLVCKCTADRAFCGIPMESE